MKTYKINVVLTVDRNILPGMKPTRHSFSCGQPLGPGVAHHDMRQSQIQDFPKEAVPFV